MLGHSLEAGGLIPEPLGRVRCLLQDRPPCGSKVPLWPRPEAAAPWAHLPWLLKPVANLLLKFTRVQEDSRNRRCFTVSILQGRARPSAWNTARLLASTSQLREVGRSGAPASQALWTRARESEFSSDPWI